MSAPGNMPSVLLTVDVKRDSLGRVSLPEITGALWAKGVHVGDPIVVEQNRGPSFFATVDLDKVTLRPVLVLSAPLSESTTSITLRRPSPVQRTPDLVTITDVLAAGARHGVHVRPALVMDAVRSGELQAISHRPLTFRAEDANRYLASLAPDRARSVRSGFSDEHGVPARGRLSPRDAGNRPAAGDNRSRAHSIAPTPATRTR